MAEHKYAEVLRAIADGKPVQYQEHAGSDWRDFDPIKHAFYMAEGRLTWRVKPKEKVKKWRWVAKYVGSDADLIVTANHYKDEAEFHKTDYHKNYILVAPVSCTMIEVDDVV